ncbi:MAG: DUF3127 domain-containing protein [Kiritimatiellae bacterium]|nr:DUF3127 domain-containing protein [Kiritimatiellia bacterium]
MAAYEMTGAVKVVMDEVTFPSGFNKREFVVTTEDDRYPQDIKFETVKEKTAMLNDLTVGQRVKVTFDLRGNEHNGRYYTNLSAWRVEAAGEAAPTGDEAPPVSDDSFVPEDLDSDEPPF